MMPALTTVVATAVSCSVLFIVSAVVGTVVWVRIRQERLSMAVANTRNGRFARGLQNFPADTVTELSREEGSALRQYGQLPYGKPTEWGLLASRESLLNEDSPDSETGSFIEKARSVRRSLSLSRSKSKLSQRFQKPHHRLNSLATLTETSERASLPTLPCYSKEDISISAVEGVCELAAETTPRQTPEKEFERASTGSGVWPLLGQREYSSGLFPVFEDQQFYHRGRHGSIAAQTAGSMPDQPVPPPPPVAYPPNRFQLSRNNSTMRLSSLSLETADSSILEDAMKSSNMDSDFASPHLPPCPTFMPFSANDVGRTDYEHRSLAGHYGSGSVYYAPSSNALSSEACRLEPDRTSPRRSLTARSPSYSSERVSPPPRRSESLSTTHSRRESRVGSLGPTPALYPTPMSGNRNPMDSAGLLPHFSQMQRQSMYDNRQNDTFHRGPTNHPNTVVRAPESPGRKPTSFIVHETPLTADGMPRQPLPSALKGHPGPRRGHRRQNCVRISIHPPMTFGGPVFSPMAEEPEESDEVDTHKSEVSSLSVANFTPLNSSSVSPISMQKNSYQDLQRMGPGVSDASADEKGPSYRRNSSRKRKHVRNESIDSALSRTESGKGLPDIFTALPSAEEGNLSRTPSPEKTTPAWMVPKAASSPNTYENSPNTGSPRRSGVRGPRCQPGKPAAKPRLSMSIPLADNLPITSITPVSPSGRVSRLGRHSSRDSRRSNGSLHRVNSDATDRTSLSLRSRDRREALEGGYGPPATQLSSCGIKKTYSTHSAGIVTIWEDQNLERTPKKPPPARQVDGPAELDGDSSPRKAEGKPNDIADKVSAVSRQEITTPTGKTVGLGLGIGCAPTPASLYDRDGFLKE